MVPHLPEQYAWIDAYCLGKKSCQKDYKKEWDATRYTLKGKFFALIGEVAPGKPIITLKLEPSYGNLMRQEHAAVTPGYYMNKLHWNSVSLASNFDEALLKSFIDESYLILLASFSKKIQRELLEG